MELDEGDSAGESTNASWVNPEDLGKLQFVFIVAVTFAICICLCLCAEAGSAQELEALDPQKRELLEARIAGKVNN